MKMTKGIDLSKHNIVTDWDAVKRSVDFVILRAGGNFNGFYKDSKFETYYSACKLRDIPVGAYYDCGKEFYTGDTGEAYAKHFRGLLSGKSFEMPVYMDIEVTPKKYRKLITDATVSFCEYMEDHRYFVGIYASDISGFAEMLEAPRLKEYSKWVARYGKEPQFQQDWGIWQHSSRGTINGIKGNVDLDLCRIEYPTIIKGGHFNGN